MLVIMKVLSSGKEEATLDFLTQNTMLHIVTITEELDIFFFNLFFIVIQLQSYAFSPLPSPHHD